MSMSTQLTDADLARLEELAAPYAKAPEWQLPDRLNACCSAVLSLVAEVCRLRAEEKARGANTLLTAEDRATLRDIVACSSSWEPEARLLGNVRAIDIYTTIIRLSAVLDTASDNAEQAEAENAALREKVEALEWLVECMDNYEWCCNRSGWFIAHGVHHEAKATLDAAREAIS